MTAIFFPSSKLNYFFSLASAWLALLFLQEHVKVAVWYNYGKRAGSLSETWNTTSDGFNAGV